MIDWIVSCVVLIAASGLSWYFIRRTSIFNDKNAFFFIINGLIFVFGILIMVMTERGPMQAIYIALFYILALLTIIDIYRKEIHLELFICVIPIVLANQLLFINEWDREKILFTGGTIAFLLIVGLVFRQGIGFGDILLFILLILALELEVAIFIIIGAFILSAMFGVFVFATRKAKRGTQIPFTQFILICYMLYIIL